jgi:hypothetical protein
MGDVISGLVWLAIILAFVTPWLRSRVTRRRMTPMRARRPTGGPRGFAESGGYHGEATAPGKLPNPFPVTRQRPVPDELDHIEEPPPLRSFPRTRGTMPAPPASLPAVRVTAIRRSLASPGSVRSALVLKEILDTPVSMRNAGR